MTVQSLLPRIVLSLVLMSICIFTYIESIYYAQHSLALGEKAHSVSLWVWVYRSVAVIAAIGCIALVVSMVKK